MFETTGGLNGFVFGVFLAVIINIAAFIAVVYGLFRVLSDDNRQGWHDKLAGTYVISSKPYRGDMTTYY